MAEMVKNYLNSPVVKIIKQRKKANIKDLKRSQKKRIINRSYKAKAKNLEKKVLNLINKDIKSAEVTFSFFEKELATRAKGNQKDKKRASRKISRTKIKLNNAIKKDN